MLKREMFMRHGRMTQASTGVREDAAVARKTNALDPQVISDDDFFDK